MAAASVLLHILRLSPTTVFTTRDVLQYGRRGAIDQCLYRMVKTNFIRRLARGVFVRDPHVNPSPEEIAEIKARSFGKLIFRHATNILHDLGIPHSDGKQENRFAINGHSSSFKSIHGKISFHGVAQRKAKLCETKAGRRVFALWHFSENNLIDKAVKVACRDLKRTDRDDLRRCSSLMPAWLHDRCIERYARAIAS